VWRALVVLAACGRIDFDPLGDGRAPDAIPSDLIAWYTMTALDVAAGVGSVTDDTGHGHTGTCTTTCPTVGAGRIGSGFSFDGTQWIEVGSTPDLQLTTGFTIAFWVSVAAAPAFRGHLVTKALGTQLDNSWALALESDLSVSVFADYPPQMNALPGSRQLALGQWHHLAFRWDGNQMQLLIDAIVDSSRTISMIGWDDGRVNMGADYEFGAPVSFLQGSLDDVRVYRRALTDAEIGALVQ
jgi:hypothetical protein